MNVVVFYFFIVFESRFRSVPDENHKTILTTGLKKTFCARKIE